MNARSATPPEGSTDDGTFGQLLDTVRRFVREALVPLEGEIGRDDLVPDDIVARHQMRRGLDG
ncbi:MAG: hypothetical protein ACR2PM_00565 [Hyphomicrobiales bacterium]